MKTLRNVWIMAILVFLFSAFAQAEDGAPVVLDASAPGAYAGDLTLTDVIISKEQPVIGSRAFAGCANLRSVKLPLGMGRIADDAFEGCENLTLYGYYSEMWAWPGEHGIPYVDLNRVSPDGLVYAVDFEDGTCAITGYRGEAEELEIPEEIDGHPVTMISSFAFERRDTLKSVTVPGSVREIGRYAFTECQSLKDVHLSEGLEKLGEGAFFDCYEMETLDLPASLISMDGNPAGARAELKAINVAEGNPAYKSVDGVVYDAALTRSIICPAGKEGTVSIPFGVRVIGEETFTICTYLTQIEIPVTVTTIEDWAFWNCLDLESISLPVSVDRIEGNPFGACWELGHIEVSPDNPNFKVVDGVLYDSDMTRLICASADLEGRFDIPDGVVKLDHDSLAAAEYEVIHVPGSAVEMENEAMSGTNLERILVAEENPKYSDDDGILYNKEKTEVVRVPRGRKGRVRIAEGVTTLSNDLFHGCDEITEIVLPEGLTVIGDDVFAGDEALVTVKLPSTVREIHFYAFRDCESLETISFPEGIETLSEGTFEDCPALRHVGLPSTLKTIRSFAFWNCENLEHLTVPAGVTYIEFNAFQNCENLTLHGEAGSYVEQFAAEVGIPFTTEPEPGWSEPAAADDSQDEPGDAPYETLQKGMKGEDVKKLQRALIDRGFLSGKADGDYGKMTAAAVQAFQQSAGLPETGVADADTQKALFGE